MRFIWSKMFYIIPITIIIVCSVIIVVTINNKDNDMLISFNVPGNMNNIGCLSVYVDNKEVGYEYSFDNGITWQDSNYGAIYQNGKTSIYVRDSREKIIYKKEVDINSFNTTSPIIRLDFDAKIGNKSKDNLLKGVIASYNGENKISEVKTSILEEKDNELLVSYLLENEDKKCYLLRKITIDSNIKDSQNNNQNDNLTNNSKTIPVSNKWIWPTNANYSISRGYGSHNGVFHGGVDIYGTGRGSPIYASRDGEIVDITSNSSSGYYVSIKHDDDYYTRYAHLQNTDGNDKLGKTSSASKYISVGQKVKAHDIIGEIGCSGNCSGVHLHFEIWKGEPFKGKSYNPLSLFS